MGKPIVNRDKWTRNDFRLLVVLLLTVIYPIIASSFFALFIFIIMPVHSLVQGPHIYWLTAALLWLVLCAVVLPCFRDTEASKETAGITFPEDPSYPTRPHAVQPFLKVEDGREKHRLSLLSVKSHGSSLSMEKEVCEEKAEKESLEKSREYLRKSNASLIEKGKITQSGEFLNEFIDSLGTDKLREEEAECQVHAEEEKQEEDQKDSMKKEIKDNIHEVSNDDEEIANKEERKSSSSSSSSSSSDSDDHSKESKEENKVAVPKELEQGTMLESVIPEEEEEESKEKEKVAVPKELEQGSMLESIIPEEEEEIAELDEGLGATRRKKALPTVDTSRASGYYECNMPTPRSASMSESNMVFLFVNPDAGMAQTEEDIIVNDQGEIK